MSKKKAQSKHGQSHEPGVAGVLEGHICLLKKVHIPRKEKVDGKADGNGEFVIFGQIKFHRQPMHDRQHQQGNQKPQLCPGVSDGTVQEDEFQQKILVKQGCEVVSYAVTLDVAHDEVKDNVKAKADPKIFQRTGDEGARFCPLPFFVGMIEKVTRDQKEHGHRQTEQGVEGVVLLGHVNEDDQKA